MYGPSSTKPKRSTGTELVAAFARWWIKTILLLHHPKTASAFPGAASRPWDLPPDVYPDLLNGSLPSDISLWLAVSDDASGSERLPEPLRLFLPTTSAPDVSGGKPATLLTGFGQAGTRVLLVQFVLHPLCDLEHPFERAGLLARIWPDPPERLDITTLPLLSSEGRHQLGGVFVDGGFAEHLPGGGWRTHIEAVRDGGPLRFPSEASREAALLTAGERRLRSQIQLGMDETRRPIDPENRPVCLTDNHPFEVRA